VASTKALCGIGDVVIIPNAVDVERTPAWHARSEPRVFTIAFVGRLCPAKDPLTLIDALGIVGLSFDWRLKMFGEGPLRSAVEERIGAIGLADRVSFEGFDRDWLGAGADVLVSPTRYEGMSNTLLEAAAAGMPIVTTSIPENLAVLEPDAEAFMVPPGSPEAVARAIRVVAQQPAVAARCGASAREGMRRRFPLTRMVSSHEALYERLVREADVEQAA
jgi:glycosyltransferase involved in cell wall biosynthesis